ncbi:MAG: PAS domain S-box protein [Actinomycetia bacterium]|nr:PAS domain S-box protein [Actinomycetes bacterium]
MTLDDSGKKENNYKNKDVELYKVLVEQSSDCICSIDPEGRMNYMSRGGLRILGVSEDSVVGERHTKFVKAEYKDLLERMLVQAKEGKTVRFQYEEDAPKGPRWFESTLSPIRDKSGKVESFLRVSRDITDQKKIQEKLLNSEEKYRISFDEAPIGKALLSLDGSFIDANKAWTRILGYSKEELLTKKMGDITFADDLASSLELFKKYISQEIPLIDIKKRYVHRDGRTVFGLLRANLVLDRENKPLYSIAQIEDITKSKLVEEKLRTSERDLKTAQRIAHIGSWSLDVQDKSIIASDEAYRIMELPIGAPATYDGFLVRIHPDDKERVAQTLKATLLGGPYDIEYRIVVDGRIKWLHDRAEVALGRDGHPVKVIGTAHDITNSKLATEALLQKDRDIRKAYADVFSAVTDETLLIFTPEEIAAAEGEPQYEPYLVSSYEQLAASRDFLRESLENRGLGKDDLNSLILASGEAIVNGIKHASSCEVQVFSLGETIQLKISDNGEGIDFKDLPKATLLEGFSTKKSLGMGFAIIFDICDRILLATGPEGTTILLEIGGKREEDTIDDVLARGMFKEDAS